MSALSGRQVLIVEDEAATAIDMSEFLESHGAKIVGPASNAEDALSYVASCAIDCAVLDVSLGAQTVSSIAECLAQADVPFIFVTGHTNHALLSRFASQPVITKPYRRRDILAALTAVLAPDEKG